uniref:Uncharacterized protein n=1 Tax=Oryzias latipes TaxID=8090 RepID=A0A3P9H9C0_ORYLA
MRSVFLLVFLLIFPLSFCSRSADQRRGEKEGLGIRSIDPFHPYSQSVLDLGRSASGRSHVWFLLCVPM